MLIVSGILQRALLGAFLALTGNDMLHDATRAAGHLLDAPFPLAGTKSNGLPNGRSVMMKEFDVENPIDHF